MSKLAYVVFAFCIIIVIPIAYSSNNETGVSYFFHKWYCSAISININHNALHRPLVIFLSGLVIYWSSSFQYHNKNKNKECTCSVAFKTGLCSLFNKRVRTYHFPHFKMNKTSFPCLKFIHKWLNQRSRPGYLLHGMGSSCEWELPVPGKGLE